jgi:hypothetical protein
VSHGVLRWLAALTALVALLPVYAGDSRTPLPVIEKAKAGTQCVDKPAVMRREHPDMLRHQRDDTVHGGIRGTKASLKACIDCHASAVTGSVTKSDTNFCISCHSYTAVRIDCFECHATKPQATARGPAVIDTAAVVSRSNASSSAIATLPIARQR